MSHMETEHFFSSPIKKAFSGIRQYNHYPDYLPGVIKTEVLPPVRKGSRCQVRYELNLVKTFYYVLDMFEDEPERIWWELADSNIMKTNSGEWQLKADGKNKTKAFYSLDLRFRGLVPGALVSKIAEANTTAMMTGFQKLIDEQG